MKVKVATPCVGDEEINAVADVLRSGMYVSGKMVKKFEQKWAEFIGTEHCKMLSSGTDALILSLFAIEARPGERVIVPPLTFFATVASVIHAGCRPVFADIDPETYCLDVEDVKEKIDRFTTAIMPVDIFGHPYDADPFNEIVHEEDGGRIRRKPYIIEDAAQAHGAVYKGRKCGSLGDIGCWSFYATKNMTTGEEGGAITTNNGWFAKRVEILRNHGMAGRNDHVFVGYNNRMSELGAAIGLEQLKKLQTMNEMREHNSLWLYSELEGLGLDWMRLPHVADYVTRHSWFWFPVLIDEDKLGMTTLELRKWLDERGVGTRHRYLEPLYKQQALQPYGKHYRDIYLPNAEAICGKMLGMPNHPLLVEAELNYIINTIKELK